jgi:SWI/SNF-related matrix-associated actin-dependent regulator 1 of chromatin subfamily A
MTTLKPVQEAALHAAARRPHFAYFVDMGLGKTLLTYVEALALQERRAIEGMVVICPNSFKGGWAEEAAKHGLPVNAHVFTSGKVDKAMDWIRRHKAGTLPVLIINYEAATTLNGVATVCSFTQAYASLLVCDESIKLKDPSSLQTKAVLNLAFDMAGQLRKYGSTTIRMRRFPYVRVLSGKPITQGPHDLWTQLLLAGAKLPGYHSFKHQYCEMGGWQGKAVVGARDADSLRRIVEAHAFVARKQDWLHDMPEKLYTTRDYTLGPVLQKHYDSMHDDFMVWLETASGDTQEVSVSVAIAKYRKLMQIQCGFVIDENSVAIDLVPVDKNPRLKLAREILRETDGKVAICYWHRHVGDNLREMLAGMSNAPVAHIHGGMDLREIEAHKKLFNEDPACRYILLQISAGKYGLTLLGLQDNRATSCSTMLFYENDYSLDARSQIEDRIHRIGQRSADCLYIDISGTDMDRRVVAALQRKEKIYNAIMETRHAAFV